MSTLFFSFLFLFFFFFSGHQQKFAKRKHGQTKYLIHSIENVFTKFYCVANENLISVCLSVCLSVCHPFVIHSSAVFLSSGEDEEWPRSSPGSSLLSLSLSLGRASVLRVCCGAVERRDHFFAKVSEISFLIKRSFKSFLFFKKNYIIFGPELSE